MARRILSEMDDKSISHFRGGRIDVVDPRFYHIIIVLVMFFIKLSIFVNFIIVWDTKR